MKDIKKRRQKHENSGVEEVYEGLLVPNPVFSTSQRLGATRPEGNRLVSRMDIRVTNSALGGLTIQHREKHNINHVLKRLNAISMPSHASPGEYDLIKIFNISLESMTTGQRSAAVGNSADAPRGTPPRIALEGNL